MLITKWLRLLVCITLVALPAQALAQGRSGKGQAGGKSMGHRSSAGSADANPQRTTRGIDRAQERMSDQGREHQHATEHAQQGKPENPGGDAGFTAGVRRFFGLEKSQEVMADQGRENERATQQDRARGREHVPGTRGSDDPED